MLSYRGERGAKTRLTPGSSYALTRLVIPGEHELEVQAIARKYLGEKILTATVTVEDPKGPIADAEVTVVRSQTTAGTVTTVGTALTVGTMLTRDSEPALISLPPGEYSLKATAIGRGSAMIPLELTSADVHSKIELPLPGYVQGNVTDGTGHPLPAKIQFRGQGVEDPFFGPETKVFGVRNLQYTADSTFRVEVAPGVYDLIISRGNEYDADFRTIHVKRGETTRFTSALKRSVETSGWLSGELHSHASPSGDNTASQRGRVLNLLAEHIEFAPCTEHNRISSYTPPLTSLKVAHLMATCPGIELTGKPLMVSHQNAFPLEHHPHTQDGGGPTTDENPPVQIERLAMWDNGSDKLVQQNHPNLEQIWVDRDLDGRRDDGYSKMFGFMDVVEVHPPQGIFSERGEKVGPYLNAIFPWLRMLNTGYRIPAVVNTDAHYNFHGSGWLRNYIKSSTDDPAKIDVMEMVHEYEHGHVIMANGPYLGVSCQE